MSLSDHFPDASTELLPDGLGREGTRWDGRDSVREAQCSCCDALPHNEQAPILRKGTSGGALGGESL